MRVKLMFVSLASVAVVPLLGVGSWFPFERALRSRLFSTQQAPSFSPDPYNSGYPIERSACLTIALGPSAAAECGNLRLFHALPSVRTFNKLRTPTLLYNSEFAHPYPIVPLMVTISSSTTTPDYVEVVLSLKINGTYVPKVTRTWAGNEWPSGQTSTRRVTIAYDGLTDTTGYYPYKVEVTNLYPGNVRMAASPFTAKMFLINRKTSAFGAGWWLAGLDKLINLGTNPDVPEKVWIAGDGSARFFLQHPTLPNTWYTAQYERSDLLSYDPGTSTWTKTDAAGVRTKFDANGNHTQTIDRFGRTTTFSYSSGRLDTITLPVSGLTYQFAYSGTPARLQTVTAPPIGGTTRVAQVTISGGSITSIRNPGDSVVGLAYNTAVADSYLVAKRAGRRATVDTFTYDLARRVRSSTIKMGGAVADIVWTVLAGETRGLPGSGTPSSLDTAKAYTKLDGPRTVADTTVLYQSRFGPPRRIIDALGGETRVRHGPDCGGVACGWLVLRLQSPIGRVLLASYDSHGNPMQVVDSVTAVAAQQDTTRFAWDSTFDQLSLIVPPERDSTVFFVNATNGRRDSLQDARGVASRVLFGYDATYGELMTSMTLPVVNGQSAVYHYTHDGTLRNLATVQTPKGFTTNYTTDPIGRLLMTQSPIDTASATRKMERRIAYNLRDEVVGDTSTTANVTPSETTVARNFYNAEGQVDSVQRWTIPDPAGIGTLTTRFRYDSAGRVVAEVPVGNSPPSTLKDSTVYDEAGNPTAVFTRRFPAPTGPAITMQYDVLNRLTQRIVPAVSRANPSWPYIRPQQVLDSAIIAYAYTVPQDVQDFTYKADGQVQTADNSAARVTRTYHSDGRLKSETLQIATVAGTFSGHSYVTNYEYDRDGRRRSLEVPSFFALGTRDTINYFYGASGLLSQVKDIGGNVFSFVSDERNQDTLLVYPGSYSRRTAWDPDGQLFKDIVTNASTTAPRWPQTSLRSVTSAYDARGRLLQGMDASFYSDHTKGTYSGLGYAITTGFHQAGRNPGGTTTNYGAGETFSYDPLGNLITTSRVDSVYTTCPGSFCIITGPTSSTYKYHQATGRLDSIAAPSFPKFQYDLAGNTEFDSHANPAQQRASIYSADGRLRAVDQWIGTALGLEPITQVVEEYRYDALGRRVWARMQSACNYIGSFANSSSLCYTPFVRRTIWDGNQELGELQAPGARSQSGLWEQDSGAFSIPYVFGAAYHDPNRFYGQVLYTVGEAVDQPLSITRYSYVDTPASTPVTWSGTQTIVPFWDRNGQPALGAFADGAVDRAFNGASTCVALGNGANRCYLIAWSGARGAYDQRSATEDSAYFWHGSLFEGKRDRSGMNYRRNRYYDPKTGRFTQEDPIGIAGGLNLYGFANGDPVNFSDPFGLCPPRDTTTPCTLRDFWQNFKLGLSSWVTGSEDNGGPGFRTGVLTGFLSFLLRLPGGVGLPARTIVIGKMADLEGPAIGAGERTILGELPGDLGAAANWLRNERVMMQYIREGRAFRDATVNPQTGALANNTGFLARERALLRQFGYSYNPTTRLWTLGT